MVKNGSIQKHTRLVVVTNRSIEKQIRLTVEVRIRFYVLKVAILTKFFTSKLAVVTKMLYLEAVCFIDDFVSEAGSSKVVYL